MFLFHMIAVVSALLSAVVLYYLLRYVVGLFFRTLPAKPHSGFALLWLFVVSIPVCEVQLYSQVTKAALPDWLGGVLGLLLLVPAIAIFWYRFARE